MLKKVILQKKLEKNKVKCLCCPHYCIIEEGKRGICGVKENQGGVLYSLVYGKVCALHIDPIEKKPLFHFYPGTDSLSIATVGCNFSCLNCQNWEISQGPKIKGEIEGQKILPEKIVELAKQNQCPTISYTYTEPTVFSDFALDVMKLAKKSGIKNVWVSNGFISKENLELIFPYLDAINVDLKSFSENFYRNYCKGSLKPVLETLIFLKRRKVWVEITTLAIPELVKEEDFRQIAKFIKNYLGEETPWHISRFFPELSFKMRHLMKTPIETIERACEIGLKEGLKYVYGGNVPGLASEDTYCPKCKAKMIDRTGYFIERYDDHGKCSKCGESLDIIE